MIYSVVTALLLIWAAPSLGQSTTNCVPMPDGSVQCSTSTMQLPPPPAPRRPGLDPIGVSKMFTDQMDQQQHRRREFLQDQQNAVQGIMAIENQRLQIERQKLEIE